MKAHLIPRHLGGDRGTRNLAYMCADCSAQLDRGELRETDFTGVLADLMRRSGQYTDVSLTSLFQRAPSDAAVRPDITAKTVSSGERVVIECKNVLTASQKRLDEELTQLERYRRFVPAERFVLALPARLSRTQRSQIEGSDVEVWDLDQIAIRFRDHLSVVTHPVLRPLLLTVASLAGPQAATSPESQLLNELRALPPGRDNWFAYQQLAARILERVFCPPLSPPVATLSDDAGVNRRDIILPNYADTGFWAFVRERYAADFIVIDAKNHSGEVGKAEALQILNYLKRHGAGLLGVLITRVGADDSCMHTIREHWAGEGKLIVTLDDDHVERMLRAREAGGPPEDVIRQWIQDFRLGL